MRQNEIILGDCREGMHFAYADPPYLGLAEKFYGHLHP
ncbi:hypothetical protein PCO31111_04886 [Pandoraea communis]|uniref:Uncharacterized protein n=1 Tax=Pandoraea communis TaxID=2508297 RepID=A0A5E4YX88_9BURK|nr:hypothetical protein PCO31111_04886 [Pandoraea communis]